MLLCCIGCGSEVERINYLNENIEGVNNIYMVDSSEYITISGTSNNTIIRYHLFFGSSLTPTSFEIKEIILSIN